MKTRYLVLCTMALTALAACGGKDKAGASGGGGGSTSAGTIALASANLPAGQASANFGITVNRSDGSSGPASVHYATADGTATAGTDYTARSGDVTWADGDAAPKTVNITLSNATPFSGTRTFTLTLSNATGATLGSPSAATVTITGSSSASGATNVTVDQHILVDQFGYRPSDPKVAVIRNPQAGFDASATITPGTAYEVRKADDGSTVFSADLTQWKAGATEDSSGDQGWWFDFSAFTTPGSYYVYDVKRAVRSPVFKIDQLVYAPILKAAMKMYFYQRSGADKPAQFAGNWADTAAYVGANQDLAARDVTDQGNATKVRDVSGGWFDGGETNKYVTFATTAVHQLLTAYQDNPAVFTDDFGIPESGNSIPDVIDEVKFETDWLKKMQFADGSVALKVGALAILPAVPPSADTSPRYYVPACTSSTITTAGMLAHASYVYAGITPLAAEAATLKADAIKAWNNYKGIAVKQTACDTGLIPAPNPDDLSLDEQNAEAVVAAVYLYAITGDAEYGNYVKANYNKPYMRPYNDSGWSKYKPDQGDALLFYASLSNADATVAAAIHHDRQTDVDTSTEVYGLDDKDLYRAYITDATYHGGSNEIRANYGSTNASAVAQGFATGKEAALNARALGVLHYFHGVNPFGTVYLTNMSSYGASYSMNAIFHMWFNVTSTKWGDVRTATYGPPPGFLPGGPNATTTVTLSPPAGQPRQKAYRDWNGDPATGDAQTSWEITQPGIYYQAAYVKLLSDFAK